MASFAIGPAFAARLVHLGIGVVCADPKQPFHPTRAYTRGFRVGFPGLTGREAKYAFGRAIRAAYENEYQRHKACRCCLETRMYSNWEPSPSAVEFIASL